MPGQDALSAALAYAAAGWPVFPTRPDDPSCPGGKSCACKAPFPGTRGCLDASSGPEVIGAWWRRWPTANVSVATGAPGPDVLDVDVKPDGDGWTAFNRLKQVGLLAGAKALVGRGMHRILFDFAARNQTDQGAEQLHFNATCRAAEEEQAAILGRPVFTGLQVGGEGVFLQLATVNVANEGDEKLLAFLDSDVFKGGLQLLTTAQPALAPFSALAVGLTQAIAARNRNVAVQAVDLGLDFSQVALRPRLAEGSYIAVQIPETITTVWDWQDWAYDPAAGRLVSTAEPGLLIPYNYLVVSVSRYQGP